MNHFSFILKKFAERYIFPNKQIEEIELTGHSVITGLLDKLLFYAFNEDEQVRRRFKSVISDTAVKVVMHSTDEEAGPPKYKFYSKQSLLDFDFADVDRYTVLRAIVDFISGMTDKYAVSLYQKLCGLKL